METAHMFCIMALSPRTAVRSYSFSIPACPSLNQEQKRMGEAPEDRAKHCNLLSLPSSLYHSLHFAQYSSLPHSGHSGPRHSQSPSKKHWDSLFKSAHSYFSSPRPWWAALPPLSLQPHPSATERGVENKKPRGPLLRKAAPDVQ